MFEEFKDKLQVALTRNSTLAVYAVCFKYLLDERMRDLSTDEYQVIMNKITSVLSVMHGRQPQIVETVKF